MFGYTVAQGLVHVLKACGDNLTRENVMKQAASIKDLELGGLLPGIKVNTSATDFAPISQVQLSGSRARPGNASAKSSPATPAASLVSKLPTTASGPLRHRRRGPFLVRPSAIARSEKHDWPAKPAYTSSGSCARYRLGTPTRRSRSAIPMGAEEQGVLRIALLTRRRIAPPCSASRWPRAHRRTGAEEIRHRRQRHRDQDRQHRAL